MEGVVVLTFMAMIRLVIPLILLIILGTLFENHTRSRISGG